MIRNIFFDVMGVVFVEGDDTNNLLVPFIQGLNNNISSDIINKFYLDASLGLITSKQFWKNVGIIDSDINIVENKYLDNNFIIDSHIIKTMKALKKQGYKIGLLSNDVSEWSEYLRKKFNLDNILDFCVISGDVHTRKPNMEIFDYAVNKYKLKKDESVFIDDRVANIITAEKFGFHTIFFDRYNDFMNYNGYKVNTNLDIIKTIE